MAKRKREEEPQMEDFLKTDKVPVKTAPPRKNALPIDRNDVVVSIYTASLDSICSAVDLLKEGDAKGALQMLEVVLEDDNLPKGFMKAYRAKEKQIIKHIADLKAKKKK